MWAMINKEKHYKWDKHLLNRSVQNTDHVHWEFLYKVCEHMK